MGLNGTETGICYGTEWDCEMGLTQVLAIKQLTNRVPFCPISKSQMGLKWD